MFVGKEGNKIWEKARKRLQDHLRWKKWESGKFIHCGVRVEHQKDGVFLLSQNEFVDELFDMQIPGLRRKEQDSPVPQQDQTELRGPLCGLGWTCEQTGPRHSAATGLFSSGHDRSPPASPAGQERMRTSHTHLQFSHGGALSYDWMEEMQRRRTGKLTAAVKVFSSHVPQ